MTEITEFLKKNGITNIEELEQIVNHTKVPKSNYHSNYILELFQLYNIQSWEDFEVTTFIDLNDFPNVYKDFINNKIYDKLKKVLMTVDHQKISNINNFKKNEDVLALFKSILRKNGYETKHFNNKGNLSILRIKKNK